MAEAQSLAGGGAGGGDVLARKDNPALVRLLNSGDDAHDRRHAPALGPK